MKNKIVIDFDCVGYRKHLIEERNRTIQKRDEYVYNNLMWNAFDAMAIIIQRLIEDMEDYVTFEKE